MSNTIKKNYKRTQQNIEAEILLILRFKHYLDSKIPIK